MNTDMPSVQFIQKMESTKANEVRLLTNFKISKIFVNYQ